MQRRGCGRLWVAGIFVVVLGLATAARGGLVSVPDEPDRDEPVLAAVSVNQPARVISIAMVESDEGIVAVPDMSAQSGAAAEPPARQAVATAMAVNPLPPATSTFPLVMLIAALAMRKYRRGF